MLHGACLRTWSTTQSIVALSSGEAEHCLDERCNDGTAIDVRGSMLEIDDRTQQCRGICNRRGLGKLRHVAVALLWLQQHVVTGQTIWGGHFEKKGPDSENGSTTQNASQI